MQLLSRPRTPRVLCSVGDLVRFRWQDATLVGRLVFLGACAGARQQGKAASARPVTIERRWRGTDGAVYRALVVVSVGAVLGRATPPTQEGQEVR